MDFGLLITSIIQLMTMLIVVWCLLSWFPIRWYEQPFKTLDQVVQPIIVPFRRIIPPISGIDLSPMVAILVLQLAGNLIRHFIP